MGVPVRTARGEIAAGLGVAPPAQFGTDEALAAMLPPLRRAAARIEAAGVILPP
jgi:DNA-binding IclR family transcriptional regulator